MPLTVKNLQTSSQLFQSRAGAAGAQYAAGVSQAGPKWQANTSASAANWATGVTQAITDNRFVNGVANGTTKYTANSSGKGARNYPTAVSTAGAAWLSGFQPYATVLQNLTLPPRGPVGSPNNTNRVAAVTAALRAAKLAA